MLEKLRILVVEDVASIRKLVVRLLERLGCREVYEAADTATARRHLGQYDFDVVLLDYELVGETGLGLVRALRADPDSYNRDVPVIILTGHTDSHVILAAVQAGANSYMIKPVMPDRLGQRILDVVATRAIPRIEEDAPDDPDIFWIED